MLRELGSKDPDVKISSTVLVYLTDYFKIFSGFYLDAHYSEAQVSMP